MRIAICCCAFMYLVRLTAMGADALPTRQAVFEAVSAEDWTVVSNYVSRGGDVNLADDDPKRGYTLLMAAVKSQSVETCLYLVSKGADANVQSKAGFTAVLLAQQAYHYADPEFHKRRVERAKKQVETATNSDVQQAATQRLELYLRHFREATADTQAMCRARAIMNILGTYEDDARMRQEGEEQRENREE